MFPGRTRPADRLSPKPGSVRHITDSGWARSHAGNCRRHTHGPRTRAAAENWVGPLRWEEGTAVSGNIRGRHDP